MGNGRERSADDVAKHGRTDVHVSTGERGQAKESPGAIADCLRACVYSAVQAPLNGIVQLYDHCRGTKLLPDVQFINPCKPAEFGSANWHAQQLGSGVGVAADFFVASKVAGFIGRVGSSVLRIGSLATADTVAISAERAVITKESSVLGAMVKNGLVGFGYDGLCTEVKNGKGNFWNTRFNNALTGCGTFAVLGGVSEAPGMRNLPHPLRSALAGVPAGITHANVSSLLEGKGLASGKNMAVDAYGFLFVGGALGAMHSTQEYISRPGSPPVRLTDAQKSLAYPAIDTRNFMGDWMKGTDPKFLHEYSGNSQANPPRLLLRDNLNDNNNGPWGGWTRGGWSRFTCADYGPSS